MWLNQVIAELGEEVQPNWRYFSLNQQNYDGEDDWQIWNEPKQNANWENEKIAPPLYYFLAAEAARKQGSAAFDRFHLALLTARHEEPKQTVYTRAEVIAIAEEAGLDIDRFQTDFHDLTGLDKLAEDHQYSRTLKSLARPPWFSPARNRSM